MTQMTAEMFGANTPIVPDETDFSSEMTQMTAEMFGANTPIVPDETDAQWMKTQ